MIGAVTGVLHPRADLPCGKAAAPAGYFCQNERVRGRQRVWCSWIVAADWCGQVKGATVARVRASKSWGVIRKMWFGVPAAAQTVPNASRVGSNQTGRAVR